MKLLKRLFIALVILLGFAVSIQSALAEEEASNGLEVSQEESKKKDPKTQSKKNHVLLLGIDTTESGDLAGGRSDTIVLISGDPETGEGSMTSIPRDSLVNIPGHGEDKINHAYAFGRAELSKQTIENLLDIEIDNYVVINMTGLDEMVEAVGGVKVVPPTTFSIDGYTFEEGQEVELDGASTVAYVRERKSSGGDYARQARQRDVIKAIVEKAKTANKLTELPKLLKELHKNLETSFGIKELTKLVTKNLNLSFDLKEYQLEGDGQMINGGYYDIIDEDSLQEFKERVH